MDDAELSPSNLCTTEMTSEAPLATESPPTSQDESEGVNEWGGTESAAWNGPTTGRQVWSTVSRANEPWVNALPVPNIPLEIARQIIDYRLDIDVTTTPQAFKGSALLLASLCPQAHRHVVAKTKGYLQVLQKQMSKGQSGFGIGKKPLSTTDGESSLDMYQQYVFEIHVKEYLGETLKALRANLPYTQNW